MNTGDKRYIRDTAYGFQVVITRLQICQNYSRTVYGEAALPCALFFRDRVLERERLGVLLHTQPRTVSKGGACELAGVELIVRIRSVGNGYDMHFIAQFRRCQADYGKRSFSIRKYGYVGAFQRALEVRIAMTGLPIDPDSVPLPRPTVDQFLILHSAAQDVPAPFIS